MTATAAAVSPKRTSGRSRWRAAGNVRRASKLDRETRQTDCNNIFRWDREGWGRYTQADPIGLKGGMHSFAYAEPSPLAYADALGLKCCKPKSISVLRTPVQTANGKFAIRHLACADVEDSSKCEFKQVITQQKLF